MTSELVEVLYPPRFEPSGVFKPVAEALNDGDWVGVMNLWIVRPGPTIVYQQRPSGGWAPGKLDGSVGGYYQAGESGLDGLREAEEELGWRIPREEVIEIGRHLSVGVDSSERRRHLVVTVFMTSFSESLSRFVLDPKEVPAIYEISADQVIDLFTHPGSKCAACGIDSRGEPIQKNVSAKDFSYVFGDYHLRIARAAKRFSDGEQVNCY